MKNTPGNDWTIEDLHAVARDWGIEVRDPGGSHHIFSHPDVESHLSVPAHRPIKPVYIKRFIKLVNQLSKQVR